MQTEISLGWSACLHAGRAMDRKKDIKVAISMLKRNNCLKAINIARSSRNILGANGLLEENHIMRHLVSKIDEDHIMEQKNVQPEISSQNVEEELR